MSIVTQNLEVKSITVLIGCSDGSTRNLLMTEREARKLHSLLKHQVFGGVLRLSANPIPLVKPPEPEKSRILTP